MNVTGIIAEYNPFHNGHAYHIRQAREMTGADFCVAVMSGDYTQRGEPALLDKYVRTEMALANGIDLVLELPVAFACASAPRFAAGAVALLHKLGVVDCLVFGSECGDVDTLSEIAAVPAAEPPLYTNALKDALRRGLSYPAANADALLAYFASPAGQSRRPAADDAEKLAALLASPNNVLGIEYCKSLQTLRSPIRPVTVLRRGSSYSDPGFSDPCNASALAIRTALRPQAETGTESLRGQADGRTARTLQTIAPYVPASVLALMRREYGRTFPVFPDTLSRMLHYKLLMEAESGFTRYLDVSGDLSDRIRNHIPQYEDFTSFCLLLKTKDNTYTRISRCLLHILLDIRKPETDAENGPAVSYARILGFRREALPLLTAIKGNTAIPLISKLADAGKLLDERALRTLKKDIQAARLYDALILHAFQTRLPDETRRQIIRL